MEYTSSQDNKDIGAQQLISHRKSAHRGYLSQKVAKSLGRSSVKSFFSVLTDGHLFLYDTPDATKPRIVVDLDNYFKVEHMSDSDGRQLQIIPQNSAETKLYILATSDRFACDEWVEKLTIEIDHKNMTSSTTHSSWSCGDVSSGSIEHRTQLWSDDGDDSLSQAPGVYDAVDRSRDDKLPSLPPVTPARITNNPALQQHGQYIDRNPLVVATETSFPRRRGSCTSGSGDTGGAERKEVAPAVIAEYVDVKDVADRSADVIARSGLPSHIIDRKHSAPSVLTVEGGVARFGRSASSSNRSREQSPQPPKQQLLPKHTYVNQRLHAPTTATDTSFQAEYARRLAAHLAKLGLLVLAPTAGGGGGKRSVGSVTPAPVPLPAPLPPARPDGVELSAAGNAPATAPKRGAGRTPAPIPPQSDINLSKSNREPDENIENGIYFRVSREDVKSLLADAKPGTYLVRSDGNRMVLCIRFTKQLVKYNITSDEYRRVYVKKEQKFSSVEDMVKYYAVTPLRHTENEQQTLTFPCPH